LKDFICQRGSLPSDAWYVGAATKNDSGLGCSRTGTTDGQLLSGLIFLRNDEHKQKHIKLTEHVVKLKRKFDSGEISNPIQITNILKDWLS
jgi:hypothetical protein